MHPARAAEYVVGTRVKVTFRGWIKITNPDGSTYNRIGVVRKLEGVVVGMDTMKGEYRGARPKSSVVVKPDDGSENVYCYERSEIKILKAKG